MTYVVREYMRQKEARHRTVARVIAEGVLADMHRTWPAEHSAEEIADRVADYDHGEMKLAAAERNDALADYEPERIG